MSIHELFSGIAIVIDDEVDDKKANIQNLLQQIERKNLPALVYKDIPDDNIIKNFDGVSFILLDWRIETNETSGLQLSGVSFPDGYEAAITEKNVEFLRKLKSISFVPVFIFTNNDIENVKIVLKEKELYFDDIPNFIFVENKTNLVGESKLFEAIEQWIVTTPSVYVLKEWEQKYKIAKNQLFWDFYERSPIWPKILWDTFKQDGLKNVSRELGEIITRNLYTRLSPVSIDETLLEACVTSETDHLELRRVLEGERFIKVSQLSEDEIFTGDIYREERTENGNTVYTYWLNIRAQCDLVRDSNPDLYCLRGRIINEENLGEVKFENGNFIEKKTHVIIACIDDGKVIEFLFYDLKIIKWNAIKIKRIGRLLPPYITRIQQQYSIYFQRQGLIRNPDEAFPGLAQAT